MASTNFTTGTTITSTWLNEVDAATFDGAAVFTPAGTGAVATTTQTKLRQTVSVKDFGAVGDGTTDDAVALQAAITACVVSGAALHIPAGTYITSQRLSTTVNTQQSLTIVGDGFGKSIIRKTNANTDAVLRIGSPTATSYSSNVNLRGFTIEGAGTATTSSGIELYDVVQSVFRLRIRLCGNGLTSYGGISLDFTGCDFNANLKGAYITKFTSLAGGGWPNIFNFNNAMIKNNTQHGIYFDYGRMLNVYGGDIEGNGTSGDATTGGIWIGSHIGEENSPLLLSPGCNIGGGTWFEANAGRAAVVFESGRNTCKDSYFIANPNATNDIYVSGGRYVLENVDFDTNKAANILEGASVTATNYILNCDYNAATTDSTKTVIWNSTALSAGAITATTLTATGQTSLGGSAGAEGLRVKTQASAVNRIFVKGGTAGSPAQIGVEGEANASWYSVVGGTGIYQFTTGGGSYEQVRITNTTNATTALILSGGTSDAFLSATSGGIQFGAIPKLPTYTVATLPSAASNVRGMIYVSDGTSNKRFAVSDGVNWRWPDGAIVS